MAVEKISHLSSEDHALVSKAVGEAEKRTDGEIVTIVTDLSDSYRDIAAVWASIMTFASLILLTMFPDQYQQLLTMVYRGWNPDFQASDWLAGATIIGGLVWAASWLLLQNMSLRLRLTPQSIKAARVQERAMRLFHATSEARTDEHTAILLFLSMHEHRAEIIADKTIADKVDPSMWGAAMASLIAQLRNGQAGKGMAEAVEQIGTILAEHIPKSHDNTNELPNRLLEL